jgi:hypothetical protein
VLDVIRRLGVVLQEQPLIKQPTSLRAWSPC